MQAAGGAVIREESVAVQVHDIGPAEVGPEDGRVVSQMDQRPISADRNSVDRPDRGKGLAANSPRGGVDDDLMASVHEVPAEAEDVPFDPAPLGMEVRRDVVDFHRLLEPEGPPPEGQIRRGMWRALDSLCPPDRLRFPRRRIYPGPHLRGSK